MWEPRHPAGTARRLPSGCEAAHRQGVHRLAVQHGWSARLTQGRTWLACWVTCDRECMRHIPCEHGVRRRAIYPTPLVSIPRHASRDAHGKLKVARDAID